MREKILTVTLDDCEVQTFRSGGPGGQNQNKRNTGVRIIHHPSGSRGESREERTQLENKKLAFKRMAESNTFKAWIYAVTRNLKTPKQLMEEWDKPEHVKTEVKEKGKWVEKEIE